MPENSTIFLFCVQRYIKYSRNQTRLQFFVFCTLKQKVIKKEAYGNILYGRYHRRFHLLIIGLFHPIVIKVEYHTGTRYWWVFLVAGIISVGAAFLVANVLYSALLGVLGASCLWSIGELFEQKERCEKGWFP